MALTNLINSRIMDKTLLTDLKKKMFIRSSLLALDSIDELLGLNDKLSADEILLEIIKKALREFEISNPLILEMKMNRSQMGTCYGMEGFYEIKSNFTLYLDGATSYPTAGGYSTVLDYRRPYVFLNNLPSNDQFYLRGICARPIIPDFLPDKTFNSKSETLLVFLCSSNSFNSFDFSSIVLIIDSLFNLIESTFLTNSSISSLTFNPSFNLMSKI